MFKTHGEMVRRMVRMRPLARVLRARPSSDDRGAVIIIMAFLMVAILGMTAIVFDLGIKRAERRELVSATDSGALAAAGAFALGEEGCGVAEEYVLATDPGAVLENGWCLHDDYGGYGVVTVRAVQPIEYTFAPVLGVDSGTTRSFTKAAYGLPERVTGGLRPFGLCIDAMASFPQWHLPLTASTGILQVPYGKDDQPEACNGDQNIPGNWAIMDFNGGNNSQEETRAWILNGYDGDVYAGTPLLTCAQEPDKKVCIDGNPGAWSDDFAAQFQYLMTGANGGPIEFTLPIFDSGGAQGAGGYFHIIGFVRAKLHYYKGSGPAAKRYFGIEFLPGLATGAIGDGNGIDTGIRVIGICGVEAANNC